MYIYDDSRWVWVPVDPLGRLSSFGIGFWCWVLWWKWVWFWSFWGEYRWQKFVNAVIVGGSVGVGVGLWLAG